MSGVAARGSWEVPHSSRSCSPTCRPALPTLGDPCCCWATGRGWSGNLFLPVEVVIMRCVTARNGFRRGRSLVRRSAMTVTAPFPGWAPIAGGGA
jgi:hypothetical protein